MKRTVQKITPSQMSSFDQQFWPVVVALTVLSGIAIGAVLTILQGPWMWGSLVGLPLLSAFAIFLLFHIDDRRLRRSFQFAIILSLAAHLLVLIFASVVNVFENPYKLPEKRVSQRQQVRTIEISDQRASFVWEETNDRETPEPEVEPQRENQPTTQVQPQPVPVKETTPQVTPQLNRRETPQRTVPRQNRELSKLRRQRDNLQPRSSQKLEGVPTKVATQPVAQTQPRKVEATESSSRADEVAKSTPAESAKAEAQATRESPATPEARVETAVTPPSPRRARTAESVAQSAPNASASSSRIRRSTPRLPVAGKSAPATSPAVAKATTNRPTAPEPSQAAGEMTRRASRSSVPRATQVPTVTPRATPRTQIARAAQRRETETTQPTIANPASRTSQPRRSTLEAAVASSPVALERPSRAAESQSASRQLNPKTLSVSRSTSGAAGVGRSNNLDRFTGGEPSPASQASDSARRERTLTQPSEVSLLTSSQRSRIRRAQGQAPMPTSSFKADTNAAAKIAGSSQPSERSLESSAANITSASTAHRDEMSAERGSAVVDLGPTKIVEDQSRSQRRSGGGQTEVAQMSPEPTRRSRDRASVQPTLDATIGVDVAAPRNLSAAPTVATALEASEEALVQSKSGGTERRSAERATALEAGAATDLGNVELSQVVADARDRGRTRQEASGWQQDDDLDDDEDNRRGRSQSRLAQAPVTRLNPGVGLAERDGPATTDANRPGEEALESLATDLARRSTAAQSGAGIGRAASNPMANASSSLTAVDGPSSTRRVNRRDSASRNADGQVAGLSSERAKRRGEGRDRPSMNPVKLAGNAVGVGKVGQARSNDATAEGATVESRAVDVARSSTDSSEQLQGARLEVEAMDGPAGLGQRPDELIGVLARPASRESEQLMPDLNSRFRNRDFGGVPAVSPDAVLAQKSFRNRNPSAMSRSIDPATEASIQLGLEFLARNQLPDGSWSLVGFDRNARETMTQLDSDTAATGLALLAFQGAGYNHREYKYARQLDQAVNWLIENQAEDGGLYVESDQKSNAACRLYSHGIAALALTEAYGMTQDPKLKVPAQKALDYIDRSQDPRKGGWRYFAQPGKKSADTSVSGWMMMAMQSGRLAGLNVSRKTFDGVDDWLDQAADPENASLYRYNPYAVDSKGISRVQGKRPTPSMTSVGLLMRIYSGWRKDDPRLLAGADYLLEQQMPSDQTPVLRDTYYWYYATQVLKHLGGERWERWDQKLRPLLTQSQEKTGEMAGSWHPYRPVPDRWGAFGGRLYVTTMNLLSLEVRHRLLPLYQQDEPPLQVTGIIETGQLLEPSQIAAINAGLPADSADIMGLVDVVVLRPESMDRQPEIQLNLPQIQAPERPQLLPAGEAGEVAELNLTRLLGVEATRRVAPVTTAKLDRAAGTPVIPTNMEPADLAPVLGTKGNRFDLVAPLGKQPRVSPLQPRDARHRVTVAKPAMPSQAGMRTLVAAGDRTAPNIAAKLNLPDLVWPNRPISDELVELVDLVPESFRLKSQGRFGTIKRSNASAGWTPASTFETSIEAPSATSDRLRLASSIRGNDRSLATTAALMAQLDPATRRRKLVRIPVSVSELTSGNALAGRGNEPGEAMPSLNLPKLDPPAMPVSRVDWLRGTADAAGLTSPREPWATRKTPNLGSKITLAQWSLRQSSPQWLTRQRFLEPRRETRPESRLRRFIPDLSRREEVSRTGGPRLSLSTAVARLRTAPPTPPMAESTTAKPAKITYGQIGGTVTLDGDILRNAKVTFVPVRDNPPQDAAERDGDAISVVTDGKGEYSFTSANDGKGLPTGAYTVEVTTASVSPDVDVIDLLEVVPRKYNAKTTLKVIVEPGAGNRFDWKLESVIK